MTAEPIDVLQRAGERRPVALVTRRPIVLAFVVLAAVLTPLTALVRRTTGGS